METFTDYKIDHVISPRIHTHVNERKITIVELIT